jgi:hypothetical protein
LAELYAQPVDRLISLFSVYDFFSYVLSGGMLLAGAYWTLAGVPDEPGTAVVLGLIAAAYIAGHLVQALGARWEKLWWKARGGWPSDARLDPGSARAYDLKFRAFVTSRLVAGHGSETEGFATPEQFAFGRHDLRARGADGRAELMNTLYALSRGLATSSAILTVVFVIAWLVEDQWDPFGWAALILLGACAIFVSRLDDFGHRFADQVWKDFAAGVPDKAE